MEGQQLGPGGTYAGDQSSGVTRHDLVYLRKDSDLQMPEVCPFLPSALTPPRGISPLIWTAGQPPWLPTCCPHLRWTHHPPPPLIFAPPKKQTSHALGRARGGLSPILPGSLQISARADVLWEVFLSLPGRLLLGLLRASCSLCGV